MAAKYITYHQKAKEGEGEGGGEGEGDKVKRIFGYFAASVVRGVEEEEKRAAEAEAGEKREAIPWS